MPESVTGRGRILWQQAGAHGQMMPQLTGRQYFIADVQTVVAAEAEALP
jgi:hypothetical protein